MRAQIVQVTGRGIDNAERPLSPGTERFSPADADIHDSGVLVVTVTDGGEEVVRRAVFAPGQWDVVGAWTGEG